MGTLRDKTPGGRVYRLKVDSVLDGLKPEDAAQARDVLHDLSVSCERLSDAIEAEYGVFISPGSVRLWRKRNVNDVA